MEVLKIKKLRDNAVIPKRATEGSAGMDLYACIDNEITIEPGSLAFVPTGIAIELPSKNYMANIYARSGVGVVDSDYRGEVCVGLCNVSDAPYTINVNERIAQIVIVPVSLMPVVQVQEITDTSRGEGGFGSTGKK